MIRHITTKKAWEEIQKDGFIRPQGDGNNTTPETGYISFELYKSNKIFYKSFYFGNQHRISSKTELIGLILDENELNNRFEVIITNDTNGYKEIIN